MKYLTVTLLVIVVALNVHAADHGHGDSVDILPPKQSPHPVSGSHGAGFGAGAGAGAGAKAGGHFNIGLEHSVKGGLSFGGEKQVGGHVGGQAHGH